MGARRCPFFALDDWVYAARVHAAAAERPTPPAATTTDTTPTTPTTPPTDTASHAWPGVPHVRLDGRATVGRLRVVCPDQFMDRVGRDGGGERGSDGVPTPDIAI